MGHHHTTGLELPVDRPSPCRGVAIPGHLVGSPMAKPLTLTIVVDTIDETNTHLSMVVGHKHDVEDVLTIGVQLPQPLVHSLQSLDGRGDPSSDPRD